ncbi:MAG: (Fe-S)-binding protein [Alphaproteobacteria bacterium]
MPPSGNEGGTQAPTRHPIPWRDAAFYDEARLDAELRRVFDICHGCRRCFNLCDSFPRLFDLIDAAASGELDTVASAGFKPVVDACTLCDMCFMTKCPYVPPHEFNLDFPHLMLRARAVAARQGKVPFADRELAKTDRNGRLAARAAPLANWASATGNRLTRPLLEKLAGVHREAELPRYHAPTFQAQAARATPELDRTAPAFGRKAVLYATCFVNYNEPAIGRAALAVLARNGVATRVEHPACCGMPQLEQGDLDEVARRARQVAAALLPLVDDGYTIVALVPSCALMLKFEWPLILPEDAGIRRLAAATMDLSQYVVDIARNEGLAPGMAPLDAGVTLHLACHARAQNMGAKAAEMLRRIPEADVEVIERCSGHGGSWGVKKDFFEVAMKVGKPVARQAAKEPGRYVASECPLAALHVAQGMRRLDSGAVPDARGLHPIVLMARAYGLDP